MILKQNIKIAVDAIVFGYQNNSLYVLLIKQKYGALKNSWVLPGGFVKEDDKIDDGVVNDSLGTVDPADSTGSDPAKETGDAKAKNKDTGRED